MNSHTIGSVLFDVEDLAGVAVQHDESGFGQVGVVRQELRTLPAQRRVQRREAGAVRAQHRVPPAVRLGQAPGCEPYAVAFLIGSTGPARPGGGSPSRSREAAVELRSLAMTTWQ